MKEIFEVWLGIFFLALLMVGGMSIISAGIEARNADATKTNYIAELEDSNFSASVMSALLTDAQNNDYELSLDLYHQDINGVRTTTTGVRNSGSVPDTSNVYMAKVNLSFDYSFSLLNIVTAHELIGYAR